MNSERNVTEMPSVNWLEMHETIVYMKELGYRLVGATPFFVATFEKVKA